MLVEIRSTFRSKPPSQICIPARNRSIAVLSPRLEIERLFAFTCGEPFLFCQQQFAAPFLACSVGANDSFGFTYRPRPSSSLSCCLRTSAQVQISSPRSRREQSPDRLGVQPEGTRHSIEGNCNAHADSPPCRRRTSARSWRPFRSIWSMGALPALSLALMSAPWARRSSMISSPCCVSWNG